MLTLPEHLMLIALHDSRGTVHPAAFLALDTGLRGAVLAELRLQGRLQTSASGHIRCHPDNASATGFPVLDKGLAAVRELPQPAPVTGWLKALESALPDVRDDLITMLVRRGILGQSDKERVGLPGALTHPMLDERAEEAMKARLADVVDGAPETTPPRVGTLVGLVDACNLVSAAFEKPSRDEAVARAGWVAERDAIIRAIKEVIAQTEGTWT